MIDPGAQALASSYVAPGGLAFWAWSEGGQVVTWARAAGGQAPGPTIAFAPEAAQALARLAPRGLPAFQPLVLLLAACRDGWLEAADASFSPVISALELLAPEVEGAVEGARSAGPEQRLVPLLAQVLEALTAVSALPARLRVGADARGALAEVVLEGAPVRVGPALAAEVVEALSAGVEPAERGDALTPELDDLVRDLDALRVGLSGLDTARLEALVEARRRTGLDDVPAPAPAEVVAVAAPEDGAAAARRAARLIDGLLDDPELGGLARLARDLRAAVHVPREVTQHDDLPLGGVSDISNRGPLDRLLVSELAHDDLTFTVRVAAGEALYLRREAPPRGPEGGRALLLDAGVRLWGVPRVFAAAVGLAVTARAGRAPVQAFSGRAGALVELDLTSREGLLAHLEGLDAAPHPGPLLAEFAARAGPGERLLVTHPDALDDPDLRRALREVVRAGPLLVATVARDGTYRLLSCTARGVRTLSQARLDLEALLAPPRRGAPPLASDDRLPALLARRPLPLLLPCVADAARARHRAALGVVSLTRDGRLLWFREPLGERGGLEVTDQVPPGPLCWLEVADDGGVDVLVGPLRGGLTLVSCQLLHDAEPRRIKLSCVAPPLAVVRSGAALLLVYPRHVHAVDRHSGRAASGLELPAGVSWRMGRFFCDATQWLALTADGLRPVLEPLPGYPRRALALWDRAGREGPWAIEADGVLLSGAPVARIERLPEGEVAYAGVEAISHDGERLLLRSTGGGWEVLDVETSARQRVDPRTLHRHRRAWRLEQAITRALSNGPRVRTRLQGLAVDGQGALALVSRRRRVHVLEVGRDGWLTLRPVPEGEGRLRSWRPFEDRPALPGAGWSLRVATWAGGSRAFLDGRGLLHLLPGEAHGATQGATPEVSLVLADGPLAAWTTEGELTGPPFFTGLVGGDVPRDEAARAVLARVARFCEAIR